MGEASAVTFFAGLIVSQKGSFSIRPVWTASPNSFARVVTNLGAKEVTQRKKNKGCCIQSHHSAKCLLIQRSLPRLIHPSTRGEEVVLYCFVYTFFTSMQCLQCMLELQEHKPKREKASKQTVIAPSRCSRQHISLFRFSPIL